jgi:putative hydrolase of the HAD superfamily
VNSIRQYALQFAEDFCQHLVPTSREGLAEVLIAADGLGYRPATRTHDIAANLAWTVRPTPEELTAHWRRHFTSLAVAMDGAVEVLETLQRLGIAMGLITNGTVRSQAQKLDLLGLRSYFQAVVVSEAVGVEKPHAAIFQHALDGLGLRADHAWFVGDHPENDILGASRVGLRTVWLRGSHPWPGTQAVPHHQIDHLQELVPLLMSARAEAPEPVTIRVAESGGSREARMA